MKTLLFIVVLPSILIAAQFRNEVGLCLLIDFFCIVVVEYTAYLCRKIKKETLDDYSIFMDENSQAYIVNHRNAHTPSSPAGPNENENT